MTQLEDIREILSDELEKFEQLLKLSIHSDNALLNNVLQNAFSRSGKQLRPIVVILAAKLCNGVTDKTIQTAVALELLHTATLIHDDVVDESPIRRGEKAIHTRFTNNVAVLTGDYLLAQSIALVAKIRNIQIFNIIAEIGKQLAKGELLQLDSSGIPANGTVALKELNKLNMPKESDYMQIIEQKTASLFAACCQAGAASSAATMKQTTALSEFGKLLGICFQMQDDLLDYSDSEELGKPTMQDIKEGKITLPLIVALNRATKEDSAKIFAIINDMQQCVGNAYQNEQEIKSFVLRYGGIDYARQKLVECYHKAIYSLDAFPQSEYRNAMTSIAQFTINRLV